MYVDDHLMNLQIWTLRDRPWEDGVSAYLTRENDDDDDNSDYSSPLRGMSSLPEARQDSGCRQVNLTPLR